jgi:hypothetical protein
MVSFLVFPLDYVSRQLYSWYESIVIAKIHLATNILASYVGSPTTKTFLTVPVNYN